MALGPKDLGELTEEDKKMVESIEVLVDKYLKTTYDNQSVFNVPLDGVKTELLRNKVIREITNRYTRAGWGEVDVKITSNVYQLVLKVHKPSSQFDR